MTDSDGDSRKLGEILLGTGIVTAEQLATALERQRENGTQIGDELVAMGVVSPDDINRALAKQFGMDVIDDFSEHPVDPELIEKVPYAFAKKHVVIPISATARRVTVVVTDPLNIDPLDELRMIFERPVDAIFCPADILKGEIHRSYEHGGGSASQLIAHMPEHSGDAHGEGEGAIHDLLDQSNEQAPIVKLLNLILSEAIQQGASDIHFEPYEDGMKVRYRIDGVLQDRHAPSVEYQSQLITRVKVMSKLDIAERRLPQDGRIKLRMGTREIDFRVSTVPTTNGERIVLRILDKGNIVLGLDRLGMPPQIDEAFRRLIIQPEGIILVTGPTGSGKTTTLYSGIGEVQSDEINIMTVEDPVEYKLRGIAQIGIRSKIGLTFAAGLRHILRQDPDVIMVGEIRDKETADIAVQSSLTGHLVMSTLHTNDAPSAVTRLVDMGIEPYLISSTLIGVLAQRLVRRICPLCREEYHPSLAELKDVGVDDPDICLYRGAGCSKCYDTGYSGRQGIYELMVIDEEIQRQIVRSADAIEMRRTALKRGMTTLRDHGAQLAREGVTTVAEVLRVTRALVM
ncbi:Type II secretion system protein E [Chlamydiales bacterium SCGC AG-110-P3]|nr:Type II secretion system protein E [Chlamydiales bacterium SCGC AG-110-P3]